MANDSRDNADSKRANRPSIAAHPAFPLVVALWFAALLGVGSLVLPVAVLERVVGATGIAEFLPQAAAPLGFTARLAIALCATAAGALLGLFAARRVSRSGERPAKQGNRLFGRSQPATQRRLLNAREDLDEGIEGGEAADAARAGRRRALAMEEDQGPSDFFGFAPLPGENPIPAEMSELVGASCNTVNEPEPQVDGDVAYAAENEVETAAEAAPDFEPVEPAQDEPLDLSECEQLTEAQQVAGDNDFSAVAVGQDFAAPMPLPATALAKAEPLSFSPPTLADEDAFSPVEVEENEDEEVESTMSDVAEPGPAEIPAPTPVVTYSAPVAASSAVKPPERADWHDGAPEELGLVQLVQRLGATLDKHREWVAERALAAPVAEPATRIVPQDFDPAAPDEAAEAMAAFFGQRSAPAAEVEAEAEAEAEADEAPAAQTPAPASDYQPFAAEYRVVEAGDEDDDDDDDDVAALAASFSLPLGTSATSEPAPRSLDRAPAASPATTPLDVAEDDAADDEIESYSSLLAMGNPFKNQVEEFPRVETPEPEGAQPSVLFPNEEQPRRAARAVPPAGASGIARPFDPPAADGGQPTRRPGRPAPSNDDSERALREALLNLQRMSK